MKNNTNGFCITDEIFKMIPREYRYVRICGSEIRLFKEDELDIISEDGEVDYVKNIYDDLIQRP